MLTPEELKTRGRRIVEEVFNQGDLAVVDELVSADIVHHIPALPGATPPHGVAGVKQWVTTLRGAFPDHHATVEAEIAEDDTVVHRLTAHGTHEGTFLDIPPTGTRVIYAVVEINRIGPDGKFIEHWSSLDMLGLLQQLDAHGAPAGRRF